MKLLTKVSALFLLLSVCSLTVVGSLAWHYLDRDAELEATEKARLMLHTALAARYYTSEEITPLLDTPETRKETFLPQTIPFYASTQGLNALRHQYPDYTYKEAALNPTNLRDRAADWRLTLSITFATTRSVASSSGSAVHLAVRRSMLLGPFDLRHNASSVTVCPKPRLFL